MDVTMTADYPIKGSAYVEAGSPATCFLPSCRKPFTDTCFHGEDRRYYCSKDCAVEGKTMDLSHVEDLKQKRV